jgi:probable rRNA maturation factor
MKIEFTNLTTIDFDTKRLIGLAEFSLNKLGIHPDSELSISSVDEVEMSALHERWLDEPGPTDVLSFPMDEMAPGSAANGPGILGDIVLCPQFAGRQAQAAGHSLIEELELLTVHGVLHLLGFDHREPDEKKVMFDKQDEFLKGWRSIA